MYLLFISYRRRRLLVAHIIVAVTIRLQLPSNNSNYKPRLRTTDGLLAALLPFSLNAN
jgi:hypothetical protein